MIDGNEMSNEIVIVYCGFEFHETQLNKSLKQNAKIKVQTKTNWG